MQGCTEDIGSSRIMFLEMFTAKYDLKLVAGNFLNSIGSGAAVDELLCRFSSAKIFKVESDFRFTRCTGTPFPAPIPGVNDQPACEQTNLVAICSNLNLIETSRSLM